MQAYTFFFTLQYKSKGFFHEQQLHMFQRWFINLQIQAHVKAFFSVFLSFNKTSYMRWYPLNGNDAKYMQTWAASNHHVQTAYYISFRLMQQFER